MLNWAYTSETLGCSSILELCISTLSNISQSIQTSYNKLQPNNPTTSSSALLPHRLCCYWYTLMFTSPHILPSQLSHSWTTLFFILFFSVVDIYQELFIQNIYSVVQLSKVFARYRGASKLCLALSLVCFFWYRCGRHNPPSSLLGVVDLACSLCHVFPCHPSSGTQSFLSIRRSPKP